MLYYLLKACAKDEIFQIIKRACVWCKQVKEKYLNHFQVAIYG